MEIFVRSSFAMTAPWDITSAEPRGGYILFLTFGDGTTRQVDFAPYLRGGRFQPMKDSVDYFLSFVLDEELGTLVWPNGADIAPDMLHGGFKPAWMEDEEAGLAKKRAV
jgi:hypothetical protein